MAPNKAKKKDRTGEDMFLEILIDAEYRTRAGAAVIIAGDGNADVTRYSTLTTAIKHGLFHELGAEGERWGKPSHIATCKASELASETRTDFTLANPKAMLHNTDFYVQHNDSIATHASMTVTMSNNTEDPIINVQSKPESLAKWLEHHIEELSKDLSDETAKRKVKEDTHVKLKELMDQEIVKASHQLVHAPKPNGMNSYRNTTSIAIENAYIKCIGLNTEDARTLRGHGRPGINNKEKDQQSQR